MRKLQDTKPIWHAMIWIAIYIVAVNVGDALSELFGVPNSATVLVLVALSAALLLYLRGGDRLAFYGVRRPRPGTMRSTLYFAPLFAIAFLQYVKGVDSRLDLRDILLACALMLAVGFVEELLFRGFLFRAILAKKNLTRAIIISGVTFGVGHVVNILRGYSLAEQLVQVVAAIVIGIALAYCVALTGSILPGVAFHALFNISGALTTHDVGADTLIVLAIIVVVVPYIFVLRRMLARVPAGETVA